MTKNIIFYTLSVFFLFGIILVGPWSTDEGWILYWANNYLETGRFINEVYDINYDISFTKTLAAILAVIGNFTDFSYLFARLPFFLLSIGILFLLHRLFLLLNIDRAYIIVSLLSMTIWLGYTTIIRAESLYMFSILFSVFSVVYYVKYKTSHILFIAILLNALSFSIHPNGIFGYIVLLIGFILFFKQVTKKDYIYIVSGIILGGIVLYYSLLWYQSIDEFLLSYYQLKNDDEHSIPFYHEYSRYVNLLLGAKLFAPVFIFSISGLLLKIMFWKKNNKLEQFLIISAIASLLYLFFLPVKWNYYFSVAIPILLIFIPYLLKYLSIAFSKILIVFFSLILIFFLLKNVTHNEIFLETFHIPSERVVLLQKLKKQTQNAKILLPPVMFPYLKGDGRELFFADEYIDQVDYVIPVLNSDVRYLKEKGFEYKLSFIFQEYNINLYYKPNKE
ncbi:arabinosyltransferase domain-containing protein [Lutibacter sp.]